MTSRFPLRRSPSPSGTPGPRAPSGRPDASATRGAVAAVLLGAVLAVAATALPGARLDAQEGPVLRGQVLLGAEALPDVMVTLHRVTMVESGPIDSVRTSALGTFELPLPGTPSAADGHEVYFASVSVDGILYFGDPISDPSALDEAYVVEAHPTEMVGAEPPELALGERAMLVDPSGDRFVVTDVFEVTNDGDRTWVSAEGRPVWRYPLPEGASGFQIGQSDLTADAVSFEGGAIAVSSPIPPGRRTYVVQYTLPDLDVSVELPGYVNQFSFLISETGPEVTIPDLSPQPPAEVRPGQVYRHYLGMGMLNATISISQGASGGGFRVEYLAVLLSLVLGAAGILAYQRVRSQPAPVAGPATRDSILTEIALLDDQFESRVDPGPEEMDAYRRRREALISRLQAPSS